MLPIPEVTKALEPRTVLRHGHPKDPMSCNPQKRHFWGTYEKQWSSMSILLPSKLCNILLPSKVAVKLTSKNIITKNYQRQTEYMGMRRTKIVIYNVPGNLSGDYLTSILSIYGQVEEVTPLRGGTGMANRDYAFILRLKKKISNSSQYHS